MMPEIDGIEILKRIKKEDGSARIIMMSGTDDTKMAKEALKYGAIDYFPKPIQLESLDDSIQFEFARDGN